VSDTDFPRGDHVAAAFFDLDRTLVSSSSSLALAGTFRKRGLISRRQVLAATVAQLFFARFGARRARVGQTADRAAAALAGVSVTTLREIVEEAVPLVLKPLVYREALDLAAEHRSRGERTFIVTAALQEVANALARELDFDGAAGSRAEVAGGSYTGRLERRLFGPAKVDAIRDLATSRGLDLAASTAYSDSAADVEFLEAVGRPVVVNPDRELREIAAARDWPVLRFREPAFPTR
jgi:HAD superfamily hydrolase (TIGR01490 family)